MRFASGAFPGEVTPQFVAWKFVVIPRSFTAGGAVVATRSESCSDQKQADKTDRFPFVRFWRVFEGVTTPIIAPGVYFGWGGHILRDPSAENEC